MFVSKSTYNMLRGQYVALQSLYALLLKEHNELIEQVNDNGGQYFLDHGIALSEKDIKKMLRLVHPDKHNGSEIATQVTQMLLKLKG